MPYLSIKINRIGDMPTEIFPAGETGSEVDLTTAVIMERGMQSGKPSITLSFRTQNGSNFFAQTSGELVSALYHALIGAQQNWINNPRIKNDEKAE